MGGGEVLVGDLLFDEEVLIAGVFLLSAGVEEALVGVGVEVADLVSLDEPLEAVGGEGGEGLLAFGGVGGNDLEACGAEGAFGGLLVGAFDGGAACEEDDGGEECGDVAHV